MQIRGQAIRNHSIGVWSIGGIGFTVSLFITGLAFSNPEHIVNAKIGILAAFVVAAIAGYLVLRIGEADVEEAKPVASSTDPRSSIIFEE
jgi:Na+/H+ antiporter NhaA